MKLGGQRVIDKGAGNHNKGMGTRRDDVMDSHLHSITKSTRQGASNSHSHLFLLGSLSTTIWNQCCCLHKDI